MPQETRRLTVQTPIEGCINGVRGTRKSELDPDPIALIVVFLGVCTTISEVDRRREMPIINALLDELDSVVEGQLEDLASVYTDILTHTYDTLRALELENSRLGRRVGQMVYPERRLGLAQT